MVNALSLQEFKSVIEHPSDDAMCIDVRSPTEYRSMHIDGVVNIPLDELPSHMEQLKKYQKLYIHCKSGGRAESACKKLRDAGINCAAKIDGDCREWKNAGLPVIMGKQTISITYTSALTN